MLDNKKYSNISGLSWGAKTAVWGTVLIYFLAQIAVAGIVLITTLVFKDDFSFESVWGIFLLQMVSAGVMFFGLKFILKRRKLGLVSLGFRKIKARALAWSLALFFGYLILSVSLISLASLIPGFDGDQMQDVGFSDPQGLEILVAFLMLVIVAPLVEEMVFRGFLYRGLSRAWNSRTVLSGGIFLALITTLISQNILAGVIVLLATSISLLVSRKNYKLAAALFTSSVFGLVHAQWNVAIDTFALSMVLIYLYEKTNNLWTAVLVHGLKNLIAFIVLFVLN